MKLTVKCLPPGWDIEALPPNRERRECCLRLVSPDGREVVYTHKPFQFACEVTRNFEADLLASERLKEQDNSSSPVDSDPVGSRQSQMEAPPSWL